MSSPTPNARAPTDPPRVHAGAWPGTGSRATGAGRQASSPLGWHTLPCRARVPTPATHDILIPIPLTNRPSS
jgi:hypothetical protein